MKTASQRSAAARDETVPSAPQESPVSRSKQVPRWGASGAAPAGTLHRLHAVEPAAPAPLLPDLDDDYIPRRGAQRFSLRALGRTRAGRITLGVGLAALLAGVAFAGVAVHHALFHDRRFLIATSADIDVTGNHHLTRAEVLRIFSADVQHNIFNLPLATRRAELERLPWVEHATIIRLLPNHLRIDLRERTPIAFVREGTQIGLVDATGVLLEMPQQDAGDPHYSFPVLTGLTPPALPEDAPLSTRAARLQIYTDFLHQLDSSGHKLSDTISEVDVTDPEDLKALVSDNGYDVLVHFGDQDFLHRYQQFEQHLPTWRQQYPRLASADMRYDAQVVLEMQPGSSTVPVPEPTLTAATAPPAPAPRPIATVTVPPRPVIISHNTTTQNPGTPSSTTALSSVRVGSSTATKPSVPTPNPGTPSSTTVSSSVGVGSSTPTKPSVPTPNPGTPSSPTVSSSVRVGPSTATKPSVPTPKPGAPSSPTALSSVRVGSSTATKPSVPTPKPGAPSSPTVSSSVRVGAAAPKPTAATAPKLAAAKTPNPKPQILRASTPKPHSSLSNEKLFAQLAADHKAALARAAKSKPSRKPTGGDAQ